MGGSTRIFVRGSLKMDFSAPPPDVGAKLRRSLTGPVKILFREWFPIKTWEFLKYQEANEEMNCDCIHSLKMPTQKDMFTLLLVTFLFLTNKKMLFFELLKMSVRTRVFDLSLHFSYF